MMHGTGAPLTYITRENAFLCLYCIDLDRLKWYCHIFLMCVWCRCIYRLKILPVLFPFNRSEVQTSINLKRL